MKIEQLWVYPIKSLRGTSLTSAQLNRDGFRYDRTFMLLKVHDGDLTSPAPSQRRLENMHISTFSSMALFTAALQADQGKVRVEYRAPPGEKVTDTLDVDLEPDTDGLEKIEVVMHHSPTEAYDMGETFNAWFSKHFGFKVIFAYLGSNRRPILGNVPPNAIHKTKESEKAAESARNGWLSTLTAPLSYLTGSNTEKEEITFADVAPYLVCSLTSLADVSSRLPEGEEMDITKFRPNIILSGAPEAYEEDYWAGLAVKKNAGGESENASKDTSIILTQNCGRCTSINVNYGTGKAGEGEAGKVLKKLMKDRRVDKGTKYSPVFGRYGFVSPESAGNVVTVGDEVEVTKRNSERSAFYWPGLT